MTDQSDTTAGAEAGHVSGYQGLAEKLNEACHGRQLSEVIAGLGSLLAQVVMHVSGTPDEAIERLDRLAVALKNDIRENWKQS